MDFAKKEKQDGGIKKDKEVEKKEHKEEKEHFKGDFSAKGKKKELAGKMFDHKKEKQGKEEEKEWHDKMHRDKPGKDCPYCE